MVVSKSGRQILSKDGLLYQDKISFYSRSIAFRHVWC